MVPILQRDAPVLRQTAKAVSASLIGSAKLNKVLKDMSDALASQDDGVAIAAPQIGVSLRIFVISGKVFELMRPEAESADAAEAKDEPTPPDIVFINPVILKMSREKEEMEEGCLSVRYLYGNTMRSKKARVRAIDEHGREFEMGGAGLLAQIFQHETDHLDGVLFTDKATDVRDMPPTETKENTKTKKS